MVRCLIALFLVSTLSACSSVQVSEYKDNTPVLTAESFFNGRLAAHGVVQNRSGEVIRTFNADILAYWKDGIGTLEEDFVFDDGEEQRRVWTLTPDGQDRFIGTASDVVGNGALEQSGNSIFLDYVLRVPYGDSEVDVRVDDRMYLVSSDVLINESKMTKFGIRVGKLLLVIIRQP